MFEAIIQQVLLSYLGDYLDGLDKESIQLGVWSGMLVIENIKVKNSAIDNLDLPFMLKFSHLDKLEISFPLKTIYKDPVQITLNNLFLILKPHTLEKFSFPQLNDYITKSYVLQDFIVRQMEQSVNLNKENFINYYTSNSSYMEQVVQKILDNIIIKIKNIHFRYESQENDNHFSCGFTIQDITLQTTDSKFNTGIFYNRFSQNQIENKVYKKIIINQFSIYWNSKETQMFSNNQNERVILEKMNNFQIPSNQIDENDNMNNFQKIKNQKLLLQINLNLYITQNIYIKEFDQPEFLLDLQFEDLHLNIENQQLGQILTLLEKIKNYQAQLLFSRQSLQIKAIRPNLSILKSEKRTGEIDKK